LSAATSELKITGGLPLPLILKPDPTDKTPNHFIVLCDGVQVGRIFDRVPGASAPRNATWRWSIDTKYRRYPPYHPAHQENPAASRASPASGGSIVSAQTGTLIGAD
jgi:hypothetical protein